MIIKLVMFQVLFLSSTQTFSQKYFDFFYTNVPTKSMGVYYSSFDMGLGWVYSGHYTPASVCTNCNSLVADSKVKPAMMDSLKKVYRQMYPSNIYRKIYVPGAFHHVVDTKWKPYIIKTLYEIKGDTLTPLYQVKIIFGESMDNRLYNIFDIQLVSPESMKKFDSKLVLSKYHKKVKEDKLDTDPPPIEHLPKDN